MPITWRNVGSTINGGDGASLMRGAQESMTGGFDALQKVLNNRQRTNDQNWEQGSENNTNALMNKLTGVSDPEQLQAMRERGEFQKMMQGYGAQVDQGAVRDALDGRGKYLRTEQTQQDKFSDTQFNRDLRPQVQELLAEARTGGPNSEAAVQKLAELGYRDNGEMLTTVADAADSGLDRDHDKQTNSRANARSTRQGEAHDQRMDIGEFKINDLQEAEDAEERAIGLTELLNRRASQDPAGSTKARQDLVARAKELYPDLTTAETKELRTAWDTQTEGQFGLSAGDNAWVDRRVRAIEAEYDLPNNHIAQTAAMSPEERTESATQVVRDSMSAGYLEDEGNRDVVQKAVDTMADYMANGITDSQGQQVPVPPYILELAMSSSADDFTEFDTKFPDRVIEIMEAQGLDVHVENYGLAQDKINEAKMQGEARAQRPK